MTGSYAYTPSIWPSLWTVALLITLSAYAWRRRGVHGARQFVVASVSAMLWVLGSIGEYAATELATKVLWYKFQVVWQLPTITAIACFVLEYAWPGRWLTRRNIAFLSVPSLLMVLLVLTNDSHHLMWVTLTAGDAIAPARGPANWLLVLCSLLLGLAQVAALVGLFVRSPAHRWPATIIIVNLVGNRAMYTLKAVQHPLGEYLPSEVLLVGVASLAFAVALFGFRILNPVAQAQWTAIAQMSDGMVVLDTEGRVASINPAAQEILGVAARKVLGHPLQSQLPGESALAVVLAAPGAKPADVAVGTGPAARHVLLRTSDLKDWRGLAGGKVLLLRDVTLERQAQAQIVEQQRSLATLQERERLARELHDSLGQTLAAAHLQASSARLLLDQGRAAEVDQCLARLADMTLASEVDVREYILGARTFFSAGLSFFDALRQYAVRFGQHYGLSIELSVPQELEVRGFDSTVETQLIRIIQEALSNVRKHARAKSARVAFTLAGTALEVVVSDDGRGFDPAALAAPQSQGYGLQVMRERAESLGGRLEVASQPGQGTRVVVRVPAQEPEGSSDDA